ncbi:hypothetical protein GCM10011504_56550 [Siccirubricoccus deserti]|uniref:Uncharacterized protein n=1 Tax=Siccirubricoccus deserti TaxID=2013562 RepID=A0A9X0R694_9PROT|nr:hypothetical protein [Siccirubricoccus deserti]MBC4019147.1 hypothetical protein [Siccirubricoccus deserti]GGC71564.1 hypothetical protein GCM10011504_56550 [Siccirubricoccus deserti]
MARELTWWPAFAKLNPALRRRLVPIEIERRRLLAIISAAAAPPAPTPVPALPASRPRNRTPEEVAQVSAAATAFAAEMAGCGGPEPTPIMEAKPMSLPNAQLKAVYEAQIAAGGPLVAAAQPGSNSVRTGSRDTSAGRPTTRGTAPQSRRIPWRWDNGGKFGQSEPEVFGMDPEACVPPVAKLARAVAEAEAGRPGVTSNLDLQLDSAHLSRQRSAVLNAIPLAGTHSGAGLGLCDLAPVPRAAAAPVGAAARAVAVRSGAVLEQNPSIQSR